MKRQRILGIAVHTLVLCGAALFFQSCPTLIVDKGSVSPDNIANNPKSLWSTQEEPHAAGTSLFCVVALSGDQEASPTVTGASGTAHIYLDPVLSGGWLDIEHTVAHPVSAMLHAGTPGVAGDSVLDMGPPESPVHYELSPDEVSRLGGMGMLYVNIASEDFPDGELRGDIICDTIAEQEELYCSRALTGSQEAPPVETGAVGMVDIYMNTTLGTGRAKIEHTVVEPVLLTINTGLPGVNGDILLPLGDATGSIDVTFSPAEVVRLGGLGMLYVNLTSMSYPNGEIRSDLLCGEGIGPDGGVETEGETVTEGESISEGESTSEGEPADVEGDSESEGESGAVPEAPQSQMILTHMSGVETASSGETLDIEVQIAYSGEYRVTALGLQATFPPGWKFVDVLSGDVPQLTPLKGRGDLETFNFAWFMIPAFPMHFTYRVSVPSDASGPQTYQAVALYRENAGQLLSNTAVHEILPQ